MMKIFIFSLFFIASLATTTVLNPIADGWGFSSPSYNGACYGCYFNSAAISMNVQAIKPLIQTPTNYYSSHIKFNLSSIASCSVQSASLKLTSTSVYNGIVFSVIRSQTTWSESLICDTQYYAPFYNCAGATVNTQDFTGSSYVNCTGQANSTCTSTVTTDVSSAKTLGVVAFSVKYLTVTTSPFTFYTKESSTGKPELTINCA